MDDLLPSYYFNAMRRVCIEETKPSTRIPSWSQCPHHLQELWRRFMYFLRHNTQLYYENNKRFPRYSARDLYILFCTSSGGHSNIHIDTFMHWNYLPHPISSSWIRFAVEYDIANSWSPLAPSLAWNDSTSSPIDSVSTSLLFDIPTMKMSV